MLWHLLVWIPLALLALGWALLGWAAAGLLGAMDWQSADPAAWLAWLEQWQIPVWLSVWLPMDLITLVKTWLTALGAGLEQLPRQAPALLGWVTPLLWILWGLGLALLLVAGLAGSLLVSALRGAVARQPRPA